MATPLVFRPYSAFRGSLSRSCRAVSMPCPATRRPCAVLSRPALYAGKPAGARGQAQAAFFSPNAPNPNASNGVTKEQLLEALQPVNEKINEQTNNIKEQTEKLKEQTEKLNQLCNTVAKLDKDLEVFKAVNSTDMRFNLLVAAVVIPIINQGVTAVLPFLTR